MSNLRIKQISNAGASGGSVIAFDGRVNIWQKLNHVEVVDVDDLDEEGTIEIQHDLGRKYVTVAIYDQEDQMILPDSVKVIDESLTRIGLASFATSGSNWTIVIA